MKLSIALACLALAVVCAHAADVDISALHKKLAAVNPSLTAKAGIAAVTDYYPEEKYEKEEYYPKYEEYYPKKYEKEEYYPKEEYYGKEEYPKKYEKEEYPKKYEKEYYPKYDKEYYPEEYDKGYYPEDKYYGDDKLVVKLYEQERGLLRPQALNPDTFLFSSVVTCQAPAEEKELHAYKGVIDMPVAAEIEVNPVGVCEWTVHKVKDQETGGHAIIQGSTNVVCTFTEEAERQCKGDFLCKGMSVSAQGLLYHFDQAPVEYPKKPVYPPKDPYAKYPAKEEPVEEEPVVEEVALDVMLSLINGVNGHKKTEYDNGVLQFFYGPEEAEKTGEYTLVFKK